MGCGGIPWAVLTLGSNRGERCAAGRTVESAALIGIRATFALWHAESSQRRLEESDPLGRSAFSERDARNAVRGSAPFAFADINQFDFKQAKTVPFREDARFFCVAENRHLGIERLELLD